MLLDANFRSKGGLVSCYSMDPLQGDGWAYFVARDMYEEYVMSKVGEADVSTIKCPLLGLEIELL